MVDRIDVCVSVHNLNENLTDSKVIEKKNESPHIGFEPMTARLTV